MAVPAAGVLDVGVKMLRVRLHDTAVLDEQQPLFARGHGTRETFGVIECRAQTLRDRAGIDRLRQHQVGIVVGPIAGITTDLSNETLG